VHNKRVGCRAGQCFWFESSDSNVWSVCLGVIVPIPPHTPNISGNLNIGKQHNKIVNYDRLSNWDRKNVIVNLNDSTNLDLIIK